MKANLSEIYNDTITVINKLSAKDTPLKQDSYFATVIKHCMWSVRSVRNVSAEGTVTVAATHQVQIPESENYIPYREWRRAENRDNSFTLREGDYIVRGTVEGELTASTVRDILDEYEPDVFQIQMFRDATKGAGFEHSTDGIMRFSEVYYVEG